LLWQVAHVSFIDFVAAMLPAAAVMLVLLLVLSWCWLPATRVDLDARRIEEGATSASLVTLSGIALVGMVLLMEYGHAVFGALLMVLAFALLRRRTLASIDWWLLATFAAIFLGLGHLAALPLVQHALDQLDFSRPLTLYASAIVASQLISNVPATVLLLQHASDPLALAVAVNVGGFGLAIGSMANLIALRLARQPHGMRLFHRVSIPFLLVCAPLAYLV
jgi:Na+/H+ antiporter NhaD/arsenite permease-like protein